MKITKVNPNSLAATMGLQPGDRLLKINGKRVQDEIDYKFRMTEESVLLDVEINGKIERIDVDKEYDDLLGVEFEEMRIRSCANDCVFCFVDQNPPDMRKGMYFRDGDYRMSYLHGHYITMTNMGQNELNRIIAQKLTPLYISVHVTDPELRQKLFLYKRDDNLLGKLQLLTDNSIELHTQIVLMPTLNDGNYLVKTLEDLYQFHPNLKTCTIVPVGLTQHRAGLMDIPPVTGDYARDILINRSKLRAQFPGGKSPFVLFSDEWYILAEEPFPPLTEYGDADLIENGVGQVQDFLNQFEKESVQFPQGLTSEIHVTIATGTLIHDLFDDEVIPRLNQVKNLTASLVPITNHFFGESVTVSGLLTGKDIISQLRLHKLGDAVWMSHRILNDEGTTTLDDMSLDDISNALQCPVVVGKDSFLELFQRYGYA